MEEILNINNKIENIYEISEEPSFNFDGYLKESLPDFFLEQIIGNEDFRVATLLEKEEEILNSFYILIKRLFDQIDLDLASPKYLYQMSKLLGLTELSDLTNSIDFEAITKQREYIKNAVEIFLRKGTSSNIVRLFNSLGLKISLQELWTDDGTNLRTYTNRYFKDFTGRPIRANNGIGAGLSATCSGNYFYNTYDILTEIDNSIGIPQNIQEILKIEHNNYGFIFALGKIDIDDNVLYVKNDTIWSRFDDLTPLSGDIKDFRPINDKLILLEDIGSTYTQLKIFTYNDISFPLHTEDNVRYFKVIYFDNEPYLILDRLLSGIPTIQILDLFDFSSKGSANKPANFTGAITDLIENKENQWIAFDRNNNKLFYIDRTSSGIELPYLNLNGYISFTLFIESRCNGYSICNGSLSANNENIILSGGEFYINKTRNEDEFIFLNLNKELPTNNFLFRNILNIELSGASVIFTSTINSGLSDIQNLNYLDEDSVFYLAKKGIGIYFISDDIIYKKLVDFNDEFEYQKIIPNETYINAFLSKLDNVNNYTLTPLNNIFLLCGGFERLKINKFNILVDTANSIISLKNNEILETIKNSKPLTSLVNDIINI